MGRGSFPPLSRAVKDLTWALLSPLITLPKILSVPVLLAPCFNESSFSPSSLATLFPELCSAWLLHSAHLCRSGCCFTLFPCPLSPPPFFLCSLTWLASCCCFPCACSLVSALPAPLLQSSVIRQQPFRVGCWASNPAPFTYKF